MARKSISKKLRFEIFKRDGFKCQYCGATPNKEVLQVDHITPVAEGGENDIDNLITSCQPCNIGKGARSLTAIPKSLKEKSISIAEQESQIIEYQKMIFESRNRKLDTAWEVAEILDSKAAEGYPKSNLSSIQMFLEKLSLEDVLEAADIASLQNFFDKTRTFKYFCGVCNRKIRDAKGFI
jgi:DNA-directed RNA polymerase subunit RPC12/RpoP